jgi:hypothetical protein
MYWMAGYLFLFMHFIVDMLNHHYQKERGLQLRKKSADNKVQKLNYLVRISFP